MASGDSILIIANPVSGRRRRGRPHAADIVARLLRERGLDVELRYTARGGDAERLALETAQREAGRFRCIAACGGDGTVQQIAQALAWLRERMGEAAPALGLVPAGRCNDLARALGLNLPPERAAQVIAEGRTTALDLGRVNGRTFCTVATMGFDAAVSRFVDGMRAPLTGTPAYLYGALRVLLRYEPPTVELEGDFGSRRGRLFMISTANTATYGGAIPIAPRASPCDGLLDVCVLDSAARLRMVGRLVRVVAGRHEGCRGVELLRTRVLRIHADPVSELWADGERIAQTPAQIEAVPAALNVIVGG